MHLDGIQKFLDQNEHLNISLNIYTILNGELVTELENLTHSNKIGSNTASQKEIHPLIT